MPADEPVRWSRRLETASRVALSYREVGATAGALPPGYRHVRRTADLGRGDARFDGACERLLTWQMHRDTGLGVEATDSRARPGTTVVLRVRAGPLRMAAPCRVVSTIEEPRRRGFAYGTLPGHPERGEELFVVTLDDAEHVRLDIVAFSRPARWWSRLGAPVSRVVQDRITDRYVIALSDPTGPH